MRYEDFARMIGNEEIVIDDLEPREDPLWVHTDFSARLIKYPRGLWVAFTYDREWGLLLAHQWIPDRMRAVIYRDVGPEEAAIMVQYVVTRPTNVRNNVNWFSGHAQVTMTGINLPVPYLIRSNTCIPFPPGRPTKAERTLIPA